MNIGLVLPGFSANAADWCIPALRHLARTLATQDDVRVLAIRYPYEPSTYTVDGANVIALGGALSHRAATLDLWQQTLSVLRAEHRRKPFDVLHAFWATESGLLAALAGRILGVPSLVSLAGGELVALRDIGYGDQRLAWERLKIAASLRLATRVSAGSRQLQWLAERKLQGRKRVDLAPPGVQIEPRSRTADQGTEPHVQRGERVDLPQPGLDEALFSPTPDLRTERHVQRRKGVDLPQPGLDEALFSPTPDLRTERHVQRRKGVDLAPLGVDTALFSPTPALAEQEHRIVHVGTLTPVKDQSTLLRAFAAARSQLPDARLDVVGEGPLEAELRRLSAQLGLGDSVRFRGSVDHADLPKVYRGARACVVSSRHEAQCMVALEAAACGVPVVGTRVGVLPEITSRVVNVGDHQALAAAMVQPLAVSAEVRERFALQPTVERFRALYRGG